ncbi:MAG: aquaporin [Planctomycetaceae bacterium]|nr:aquaporin [Planctomycetaceae bacterium]
MNRYISEFLGTFFLVFAGTGAVITNIVNENTVTPLGIGIVFGLIVMVIIYTIGEYSGAHINPAVTIAFWSAGRFATKDVVPYIIAQCLGATAASGVLGMLFGIIGNMGGTAPYKPDFEWQCFVLEALLTSLLMYTVMCVSTGSKEVGTLAGIAIGGLIALEAIFAGPICGASMNPARSLGPAIVSGQLSVLWIYLIAPVLGALLGVFFWKISRNNPAPVQENI